jgi:RNA polymerase sigma-70 factor, ECF subfamily
MLFERQVINKAKQGDKQAMVKLYQAYMRPLYRFVRYKVASDAVAEDIVSETYTRAFEKLDTFAGKSTFKSWLYTIAYNLIVDWYKQKSKQQIIDLDLLPAAEPNQQASQVDSKLLLEVLSQLPGNYKQVLELRFLFNSSIKETAEIMQLTIGNIKVLQLRALRKAQTILTSLNK